MAKCLKCGKGLKPKFGDKYVYYCPNCGVAYGEWIGKKLRDAKGNLKLDLITAKDSTRAYLKRV